MAMEPRRKNTANTQPTHVPVFVHIPKNAGTYTTAWLQRFCRIYNLEIGKWRLDGFTAMRFRRHVITLDNNKQLSCFIHTPTDIQTKTNEISPHPVYQDPYTDQVTLQTIKHYIETGDVEVFAIAIEPVGDGMKSCFEAVEQIMQVSKKHAQYFTFLRDPFERAKSMYFYITGESSSHEPTHNSISAKNFIEYIGSHQVEDSWFLRQILDMNPSQVIEPYHVTQARKCLDHFIIRDISKTGETIDELFFKIYGVKRSDAARFKHDEDVNKNITPRKEQLSVRLKDIDAEIAQSFRDRTYWDRKIWRNYCADIT